MTEPSDPRVSVGEPSDARKAIRFMVVKAAIFILIPALAAAVAVALTLK